MEGAETLGLLANGLGTSVTYSSDHTTPGQASVIMVSYHISYALCQAPIYNPPSVRYVPFSYPKTEKGWLNLQLLSHGHKVTKLQSWDPTLGPGLLKPILSFPGVGLMYNKDAVPCIPVALPHAYCEHLLAFSSLRHRWQAVCGSHDSTHYCSKPGGLVSMDGDTLKTENEHSKRRFGEPFLPLRR